MTTDTKTEKKVTDTSEKSAEVSSTGVTTEAKREQNTEAKQKQNKSKTEAKQEQNRIKTKAKQEQNTKAKQTDV